MRNEPGAVDVSTAATDGVLAVGTLRGERYEEALALELIDESPTNPRKTFDEAYLAGLTESIRQLGVVSPILTRPRGDRYEIVHGACRTRASERAGLRTVRALVRAIPPS